MPSCCKWIAPFLWAIVLTCTAPTDAIAAQREVINWMVLDLPPGSKPVNGRLTDGINDQMLKLVFSELPEFDHQIVVVNTSRAMADIAEGKPACFGSAAYSMERERVAYFTLAYLIPPIHVVVRSNSLHRLPVNKQGEVLLPELVKRPDLNGLVVPQRSYSPLVDEQLRQRPADSGVQMVLSNDGGTNILKMLNLGRGDYSMEYDFVVKYLLSRKPELDDGQLRLLPIAGAEPVAVGVACPHTEWGRQIIQRVDAALVRLASRQVYRDALYRWLTPESARRYRATLDAFVARRSQPASAGHFPIWPSAK